MQIFCRLLIYYKESVSRGPTLTGGKPWFGSMAICCWGEGPLPPGPPWTLGKRPPYTLPPRPGPGALVGPRPPLPRLSIALPRPCRVELILHMSWKRHTTKDTCNFKTILNNKYSLLQYPPSMRFYKVITLTWSKCAILQGQKLLSPFLRTWLWVILMGWCLSTLICGDTLPGNSLQLADKIGTILQSCTNLGAKLASLFQVIVMDCITI